MMTIQINEVLKSYQNQVVLDIPHLTVNTGQIIGLVGNNGAGKTTLLRLILDLIAPTNGLIAINNIPVNESEEWKKYTGAYLDQGFLLDFLTPLEYFYFIGDQHNLSKKDINERLEAYMSFFNGEVIAKKSKLIRDLSAGNQQKVGIVGVFIKQPKLIILDEPFNALDPTSQSVLKQLIIDYHANHQAISIVSSHDLNHITKLSNRIVLLEKGKVIKDMATDINTLAELTAYFDK